MANPTPSRSSCRSRCGRKNGRPKILPPADYLPSEDQTQDPHILRAIGARWAGGGAWKPASSGHVRDLAIAVNLAERHVSRQLRLAYLAPEVLKRLVFRREVSAVTVMQLTECAGSCPWEEQAGRGRLDKHWPQRFAKACNCVFKGYQPATTKALVQLSSSHGSGAVDQVASLASLRVRNEMDW